MIQRAHRHCEPQIPVERVFPNGDAMNRQYRRRRGEGTAGRVCFETVRWVTITHKFLPARDCRTARRRCRLNSKLK